MSCINLLLKFEIANSLGPRILEKDVLGPPKIYNSIDTVYSSIITKKSYHFLSFLLNISQSSIFFDKHIFVLQGAAYTRSTLKGEKLANPDFFWKIFGRPSTRPPIHIYSIFPG